ncbi:hypothetical protein P153DRAFT_366322 [Dothidotthia symphoricarpi CBS 119687]|uniref:Integral membrane protein n=1 Tax=Dothidotthia symphoricarpi CBS 119687 TaxID=1392245 RepID=A0A6A6ADG5_9PLEO|nr:uncharacterized protein P153DRAFT_366322 [Dothidotthia symphoricarpi CBS 119687]KAF2129810.1 hypothetical protein P153DRAFT_366322 [Dothidotthia symphoricarpi CBS 119687]
MDKFKVKTRSARNKLAEATSQGTGSGSLSVPLASLTPHDNASRIGVNEGYIGPLPGTVTHDFAEPDNQPGINPPTSLQSSVDAGIPVPKPVQYGSPSHRGMPSMPAQNSRRGQQHHRPQVGSRQASIGIRRKPSPMALQQMAQYQNASTNRTSAPLPAVQEDSPLEQVPSRSADSAVTVQEPQSSRLRKTKMRLPFWSKKNNDTDDEESLSPKPTPAKSSAVPYPGYSYADYSSGMVDVLDTIDPEVATLTSLTNVQNSLFIPNLPWLNRRPTYNLRRPPGETESNEDMDRLIARVRAAQAEQQAAPRLQRQSTDATVATIATIDSELSESRYAVLPHGTSLDGWTKDDKAEVNDHVRHMLHSKRSKFKRTMKGFGQYVRRPLGFLVTLYATLITLFGLAWVLFLIGWVNVGGRQIYIVHIIDSVLVALFAVVGDGLAPFRAVDTYHMIYIAHYHHFTWSRRKKEMLPELVNPNDLPANNAPISAPRTTNPEDPENQWEFTVLTPKQQTKLEHHQDKFCKSHSFYKPHETETHHAFPLRLLVAIVVLLDCHSLLQISLGATTWGIYYKVRPFAITTVILCCSIACNATAGLLIWLGDKKTRKTDVLERMNRQELTEEAIQLVKEKKEKENESEMEDGEERDGKRRMSLDVLRKSHTRGSEKANREESAYP